MSAAVKPRTDAMGESLATLWVATCSHSGSGEEGANLAWIHR